MELEDERSVWFRRVSCNSGKVGTGYSVIVLPRSWKYSGSTLNLCNCPTFPKCLYVSQKRSSTVQSDQPGKKGTPRMTARDCGDRGWLFPVLRAHPFSRTRNSTLTQRFCSCVDICNVPTRYPRNCLYSMEKALLVDLGCGQVWQVDCQEHLARVLLARTQARHHWISYVWTARSLILTALTWEPCMQAYQVGCFKCLSCELLDRCTLSFDLYGEVPPCGFVERSCNLKLWAYSSRE